MQVSKACVNIMNGHHEICRQYLGSKSWLDLEPAMNEHYESFGQHGLDKPRLGYVDDPEQSEAIILRCYPSMKKENGGFGVRLCAIHGMFRIEKGMI